MHIFARIILVVISVLISPVAPRAAEGCQFESWLVNTYAGSLALMDEISGDGLQALGRARTVQQQLADYNIVDIRRELRKGGMQADEQLIAQYITRQKVLLSTLSRRGNTQAGQTAENLGFSDMLADLRPVMRKLRCATDPAWRAGSILPQLDGLNLRHEINNWLIVLGAITVPCIGLFIFNALQKKHLSKTRRHICSIPCQLSALNRTEETGIVDISCCGAKLHQRDVLPSGLPCQITLGRRKLQCRIAWSNAEYCGVEFLTVIAPHKLEAILASFSNLQKTGQTPKGSAKPELDRQPA